MWMLEKFLKCPHCGTREEEWDPKQGGDRRAYIPQIFRCPGCMAGGDALEAAEKSSKATGGSHGLRVRLLPKYVVDYQVRTRSTEERQRLDRRAREGLDLERQADADVAFPQPRKAASLGGARRPPPIESGRKSLADTPPDDQTEPTTE